MRYIVLLLILINVTPVISVYAAPTITGISGTASDGQVLTISGATFGTHNLSFEWLGGANGTIESTAINEIPHRSGWNFNSFSSHVAASDQAHSGSKSLKNNLISSSGPYAAAIRYGWPSKIGAHNDIFVSWWVRRTHNGSGQWKMFRLNWQDDIQDDFPQTVMFNWDTSRQFFVRPGPSIDSNTGASWSPAYPTQDNRWYRMDFRIYTSAVGSSDGSYSISLHDPVSNSTIGTTTVSNAMSFNNSSRLYQWFLWQNYIGNGISSQTTWIDDIYVQVGTQARVELGDSPVFENCTWREIQPPTSWSNSQIKIKFNKGSFDSKDNAYLFVVDADGNASAGKKVAVGEGQTLTDSSSDNPPTISISSPTSENNYTTSGSDIAISGVADDDNGIESVAWSNNSGGSGAALDLTGSWSSFSLENLSLQEGTNVITVTATDTEGQTATDTLTVTYNVFANTGSTDDSSTWSAFSQTTDTSWKDSSVTYCVRLLVEGAQITGTANQVKLGFQGRSSGDYAIHGVSIAQRDTSGNEGDVIDSTWTQVTFDSANWTASTTISQGTEKLSDPVTIDLKSGTDYYVTLKIESPSVYLNPPSGYRELYFHSADHTTDIDWSGNGHSVTQDYHALTKIYAYEADEADGETTTVPAPAHLEVITD